MDVWVCDVREGFCGRGDCGDVVLVWVCTCGCGLYNFRGMIL